MKGHIALSLRVAGDVFLHQSSIGIGFPIGSTERIHSCQNQRLGVIVQDLMQPPINLLAVVQQEILWFIRANSLPMEDGWLPSSGSRTWTRRTTMVTKQVLRPVGNGSELREAVRHTFRQWQGVYLLACADYEAHLALAQSKDVELLIEQERKQGLEREMAAYRELLLEAQWQAIDPKEVRRAEEGQ